MTVRRLTGNGDIAVSGVQFIEGIEECAQTIRTRLNLFYGEYFRDINEGVDWFGKVLLKGTPDNVKDAEIRRRIQDYEQVRGISAYTSTFNVNTRSINVSATVLTVFGETEVTVEEII